MADPAVGEKALTAAELQALMDRAFPQSAGIGDIDALPPGGARVRRRVGDGDLRPGGTLSGPTLMALADYAFYLALLSEIGPETLAVTTSLSIHFLRKPPVADLVAEAEILKIGRRLAVGEVRIYSDGEERPVAQATVTYSIPPRRTASPAGG